MARDKAHAAEQKEAHRADSLGSILKAIQGASHHVAGHRVQESRDALGKAADELDAFINGKHKPVVAKKPAKN